MIMDPKKVRDIALGGWRPALRGIQLMMSCLAFPIMNHFLNEEFSYLLPLETT
jgi:hypothetical protein